MYYRFLLVALLSLTASIGPAFALTADLAPVVISRSVDTYGAPGPAYKPPHTDTCNGDQYSAYLCPAGVAKTCVDVRARLAPANNSNTTYALCSPNCPSDSCDGNRDAGFSCPTTSPNGQVFIKSCTDVKKMGGVRYRSSFSCSIGLEWFDVAVKCVK